MAKFALLVLLLRASPLTKVANFFELTLYAKAGLLPKKPEFYIDWLSSSFSYAFSASVDLLTCSYFRFKLFIPWSASLFRYFLATLSFILCSFTLISCASAII